MTGHLVVDSVSKSYEMVSGDRLDALTDIELDVPSREFVALLGPSGCGKSTLLELIAGLQRADEGEIGLDGSALDGPTAEVGLMFQDPVLLPWKTVEANVRLPGLVRRSGKKSVAGLDGVTPQEALSRVGLAEFVANYSWELSGGMQRRVSLARILYQNPTLLLMDEPFAGLDEFTRFRLNVLLRGLLREAGKTVLLVTHSVEEAVLIADRVGLMSPRPGRIEATVDVTLPDRRDESTMATDEFARTVLEIRRLMTWAQTQTGTQGEEQV